MGQGFQPTFRGHCSWGAGGQEGAPCSDRLMHVCPWESLCASVCPAPRTGVCHGERAPLSYTRVCTHGRWTCSVCAPCVRVHAPSVLSCSVLALPTCTTRILCTLTAGSTRALRQRCRFALTHALSTLSCPLSAHAFHTHRAHSACASCKHCTHPLLTLFAHSPHAACTSHANPVCTLTPRAPCVLCTDSLCTLCARSERTLSAGTLTGAMQVQWTLCTLRTHSAHTLRTLCALHVRSLHGLHTFSCTLCASSLCTLRAHLLHTLVPAPCTLRAHPVCPPARSVLAFPVQCLNALSACSTHTLWHTLSVH